MLLRVEHCTTNAALSPTDSWRLTDAKLEEVSTSPAHHMITNNISACFGLERMHHADQRTFFHFSTHPHQPTCYCMAVLQHTMWQCEEQVKNLLAPASCETAGRRGCGRGGNAKPGLHLSVLLLESCEAVADGIVDSIHLLLWNLHVYMVSSRPGCENYSARPLQPLILKRSATNSSSPPATRCTRVGLHSACHRPACLHRFCHADAAGMLRCTVIQVRLQIIL